MKISICIIICLSLFPLATLSQDDVRSVGIGGSGIYNFQTESFGADFRIHFPLKEKFTIATEISYFFPFNPIHEVYGGVMMHYHPYAWKTLTPYIAAGAFYNNWINALEYSASVRKTHNFAPEAGIGLIRNKGCIRPFIEDRYDVKWKEMTLRFGILFFPAYCNFFGRKENCPAYD